MAQSNDWFFELFGDTIKAVAEDFRGLSEEEKYAEWSLYVVEDDPETTYVDYCTYWESK